MGGGNHDSGQRNSDLVREILDGARAAQRMTAKDLAEAVGITPRTLRNWLRNPSKLTGSQVERLSDALRISAENRANLYHLTSPRPETAAPPREAPSLAAYQRLIDGIIHPSIVTDHANDNLCVNRPFRELFGGVAPHTFASPMRNGMAYILFHPHASDVLGDGSPESFREHWLLQALTSLFIGLQQHPGDPRLLEIEREVRRRPKLLRAYEGLPDWIVRKGDLHVSSVPRPLRDPRTGRLRTVRIFTEEHLGYQPMTVTHTTFVLDEEPASAVAE